MCAATDPVLDGYAHTAAFFGDMPRLEELFDKHQGTFCKLGPHQWTPMVRSAAALQTVAWARFVYGGGAAVWWTDGGGAGGEGGGGVVDDRPRVRRRGARRLSENSRSVGSCRASSPLLRTAGLSEASAEPLLLPCPTSCLLTVHYAAKHGHTHVMRQLVQRGADLDRMDELQRTCLIYAADSNNLAVSSPPCPLLTRGPPFIPPSLRP